MRVLVTGASGMIGSAVARAFLQHGHEVVGAVSSEPGKLPRGVLPLVADLFDPRALDGVLARVDGAVHAASSNDERAGLLDRTVVEKLLDAFDGTDRPLVYTSGLWLHGNTGDTPATEESPFAPPLVVSWRPELDKVVATAGGRNVRTVRIRPALVYGHGTGYPSMLLAPSSTPTGLAVHHLSSGENRWSTMHADDVADLYVRALESAPAGSVYLAAHPDRSHRVRDLAHAAAEGHQARVESWDPAVAAEVWGPMVEAFLLDQVASGALAERELGWRPQHPTILEYLRSPA